MDKVEEIIKRKEIEAKLVELNFNLGSKGFEYWVQAIMLYKYDFKKVRQMTERIYDEIARTNDDTRNRVERAMRTAKYTAIKEISNKYQYYVKLTNKRIIRLIGGDIK